MIEIRDLRKSYEIEKEQIDIIYIRNLKIQNGERVAITGQSGSGKSTLLHILGGVIEGGCWTSNHK